jgi:hypothetical protein
VILLKQISDALIRQASIQVHLQKT